MKRGLFFFVTVVVLLGAGVAVYRQPRLVTRTGFAFDTITNLTVYATPSVADDFFAAAAAELARLDGELARGGSVLSRIHAVPRRRAAVPPGWGEMLRLSDALYRQSNGAFDPTVTPLLDVWGFWSDRSPVRPPDPAAIRSALRVVGWDAVDWSDTVVLVPPGYELYFGAIAKGYALNRLADCARRQGIDRAVIDLGGDIALLGEHPSGRGWRIGIQDPFSPAALVETVELRDCFVATSGDYERGFDYAGRRYNHIVDPRTGYPADRVHSMTVVCNDGLQADALATALFVLGSADALREEYTYRALALGDGYARDAWRWHE